jgi:hypothetical protein
MQKFIHDMRDFTPSMECMYILMNFVVNNHEHFQKNSAIVGINTRYRDHIHGPIANLSCFQKVHTMLTSKSSKVYHQI